MLLLLHATGSSLRFQLRTERVLASGSFGRIGRDDAFFRIETGDEEYSESVGDIDHRVALRSLIDRFHRNGRIAKLSDVAAVIYRVPHGGDVFFETTVMTREQLRRLHAVAHVSPDIPASVATISAGLHQLPGARHIAVFDTAFTAGMPDEATQYPLDPSLARVRRYGFDGIAHRAAYEAALRLTRRRPRRVVSVRVDTLVSVTGMVDGVAVETTNGFTPAEGLPGLYGTGSVDPRVPLYLAANLRLSPQQADRLLLQRSGIAAIARRKTYAEIEEGAKQQDSACVRALMLLSYRIAQAIAGMIAALGRIDAIVFSGSGASWIVIEEVGRRLSGLGVRVRRGKGLLSTSNVLVFQVDVAEDEALLHEARPALTPGSK